MTYLNETITVADSAIGFTAASLAQARTKYGVEVKRIVCSLADATIRIWENGTPTSSVGHLIDVGDVFAIDGKDVYSFRAIRTGATSGKLSCAYEV